MKAVRDETELQEIREVLLKMESDPAFVTESAYRANVEIWPDHRISFIDVHMAYLRAHPQINPKHYISNLRLKLRKNTSFRS